MKKLILLFTAILFSLGAYAQFHVTSNFGEINDGDTLVFTTTAKSEASVEYKIHNDSDEPIFMRIKVLSIVNADGSGTELCLGQCLYAIQAGVTAPVTGPYPVIQPGETQATTGDHFWSGNNSPINEGEPIYYVLQFQQINGTGETVYNTLTWTYEYAPDMAVVSHKKTFKARILSTIIKNGELDIKNQEPVNVQIFNLLGQKVKSTHLAGGLHSIDISNLSPQIYLVRFHNANDQIKTQKIVVK